MDHRLVSSLHLRRAIQGTIVGFAISLLMYVIVLFAHPYMIDAWLRYKITILLPWVGMGVIGGFLAGYVIRLIGEFARATDAIQSFRGAHATEKPPSKRQLMRARLFWNPFHCILLLGLALSLWMYWLTFRQGHADEIEVIGWPWPFFISGGEPFRDYHNLHGLALDLVFWITIATITGLIARDGLKRFSIKCLLVLRYFLGVSKHSKCNHDLPLWDIRIA
jgi:hypothetical protein